MMAALERPLAALMPDPSLSSNASLLHQRLALGRRQCTASNRATISHHATAGQRATAGATAVLLPAAVGKRDGSMSINDGPEFMLTGGATRQASSKSRAERYRISQVDLSRWLLSSFTKSDFVILKMDVEGGEHRIVPKMVADGSLGLVDVWLWECHHMPRSWHSPCHKLRKRLRDYGVTTLYEDPYPWNQKGQSK